MIKITVSAFWNKLLIRIGNKIKYLVHQENQIFVISCCVWQISWIVYKNTWACASLNIYSRHFYKEPQKLLKSYLFTYIIQPCLNRSSVTTMKAYIFRQKRLLIFQIRLRNFLNIVVVVSYFELNSSVVCVME